MTCTRQLHRKLYFQRFVHPIFGTLLSLFGQANLVRGGIWLPPYGGSLRLHRQALIWLQQHFLIWQVSSKSDDVYLQRNIEGVKLRTKRTNDFFLLSKRNLPVLCDGFISKASGPDYWKISEHFVTWYLIGWQQSRQSIGSHARKSLLINMDFPFLFGNQGPRASYTLPLPPYHLTQLLIFPM